MASLYAIAFSRESFGGLIFVMIAMTHPAVMLPISHLAESIKNLLLWILKLFGISFNSTSIFMKLFKRLSTFSMVTYLAFIIAIQYYLFHVWLGERLIVKEEFGYTTLEVLNDFIKGGYYRCNCTSSEDCQNTEEVDSVLNFLVTLTSQQKTYILLASLLILIVYHLIEAIAVLFNEHEIVPLKRFVLGQIILKKEDAIEMSEHIETLSKPFLMTIMRTVNWKILTSSLFGLLSLVLILMSPTFFRELISGSESQSVGELFSRFK